MKFDIDDIVKISGDERYLRVTGVIHDDKRLFLAFENFKEFEVPFSAVEEHWTKFKNNP